MSWIDWGFNLDDLPTIRPDSTTEDAEWLKVANLTFYDDGMSLEDFRVALARADTTPEEFKKLPTYKAALARGEPEWIRDL
jgi:hypothetical protein